MNYIFLDVDGVLNDQKYVDKMHKKYGGRFFCENMPFNPKSLRHLSKIVHKTNAKVILSSTWRYSESSMSVLEARLAEYNIRIDDTTPKDMHELRGKEINAWCKKNLYDGDKFIIIDDEMFDIHTYYDEKLTVWCSQFHGLTYFRMIEAIYKLNKAPQVTSWYMDNTRYSNFNTRK